MLQELAVKRLSGPHLGKEERNHPGLTHRCGRQPCAHPLQAGSPSPPPRPGFSPLSSLLLSRLIFIGPGTQRACPQGLNPGCLTRPCLLHQHTRAAQEELRGLTAPYWLSSWLCFSWRAATVAVAVAVAVAAAAATAAAAAA